MKRGWKQFGKVLISIGLLGWFFIQINPQVVWEVLASAQWPPLVLAMSTMTVGLMVSVHKWRVLLLSDGVDASFTGLFRYYLIGIYFNNFLPTSIGGDAMRAWLVSRRYERAMPAVSSVLAERLSGLLALLLVAGAGSLEGQLFPLQRWLGGGLLAIAVLMILMVWTCRSWRFLAVFPWSVRQKLSDLLTALARYSSDCQTLVTMGWVSMIYPLLVGLVYYWAGNALDINVSLFDMVVSSSLVTLLTLVPISLNGLGLREGGFVYLLGLISVPQAQALSLSLLVFGFTLLLSLIGGLCLIFERGKGKVEWYTLNKKDDVD